MKRFADMTYSTQRMVATSLIGKRAALELADGRGMSVEPIGLGTELGKNKDGRFQGLLVAKDYFSGDILVVALRDIATLQEQERPITDPQHPDWEDPGRKVRPAKPRPGERK